MIRPVLRPKLLRIAAIAVCAAALSGCISLLPKTKPAQLYRFGAQAAAVSAPARPASAPAVFLTNGTFQEEASDDRMLTVTGGTAAYIAQSRWVAPADILFEEAVARAFDASPVRLIARGQQGRSAYALRVDVRAFETRYDRGDKDAPVIVVRVHAALTRADQSGVGEEEFEARVPASDNRVGAIVTAYNTAVGEVVGKVVSWTEKSAT